jgi:hypothetical protein
MSTRWASRWSRTALGAASGGSWSRRARPARGSCWPRPATTSRPRSIGGQGGGRVWLFLHTDAFEADHARLSAAGVKFLEEPRHEVYGSVAVFEDLYGNRWDLLQPKTKA